MNAALATACADLQEAIDQEPGVTNPPFSIYLVGGAVRDKLLGLRPHDLDYVVVANDLPLDTDMDIAFTAMTNHLTKSHGVEWFVLKPEYGTARGRFPKDHPTWPGAAGDWVLARREGPYTDGRRPDWVQLGTLADDLNRRDLTINAMAQDERGNIIDYHDGMEDLKAECLRFVGDPAQRIREDALRVLRLIRFAVTKGFQVETESLVMLDEPWLPELVAAVAEERREVELRAMMRTDSIKAMQWLCSLPDPLLQAIFAGRVRLDATLRQGY